MIAQQNNVDTIANNLANVNTTGYKTETNEFKSLLYQTLQTKTTTANAEQKPIGAQVGLGVRNASITSQFSNGALLESESTTSFAVQGKGFFAVRGNDGQTYYTRNGDFNFLRNQFAAKSGSAQENRQRPEHGLYVSYGPFDNISYALAVQIPYGYSAGNAALISAALYEYLEGDITLEEILANSAASSNVIDIGD